MKPEPKYSKGQAVIVRCDFYPQVNSDFSIVEDIEFVAKGELRRFNGEGVFECSSDFYSYALSTASPNEWVEEQYLRPIPPEEHNGIDAKDYINKLCSVEVEW